MRHGESAGNVARDRAEASGASTIELQGRDVDVPLSDLGERQARALGRWFRALPSSERPTLVLTSPFARAARTAELLVKALDESELRSLRDERLREKEFGSLNRLTRAGIQAAFPQEAERRAHVGKFYYRPPGGESWCDVVLRLRTLFDHLQLFHSRERVLVVAHQVIILCARYILEQLSEQQLLEIDRAGEVANCSVTSYVPRLPAKGLELRAYNFCAPLEMAGEPVTDAPDAKAHQA